MSKTIEEYETRIEDLLNNNTSKINVLKALLGDYLEESAPRGRMVQFLFQHRLLSGEEGLRTISEG